ncbi:MAG: dimethylhistidine N-methyltransferase [Acidobacteria bacterium RIFCSPLOWO2_02_FULL_67_21]|nr:MAG: dimethylhistidine N-methyltransferase [Acidobacteria bacterium RIFCSPLOWO2_02_FULL_67_21]
MTPGTRLAPGRTLTDRDIEEIHYYLAQTPRQLPSRLLYDALGSTLFEAICLLPWYRITRAEKALLARHGAAIARRTPPTELVELGCGNGQKLVTLLRALGWPPADVHLIDVSREALDRTTQMVAAEGPSRVHAVHASYEEGLMHLPSTPDGGCRLVLFLGSNIGNFDPPAGAAFLHLVRRALGPSDALLLGVDLVKPHDDLMLAYDDPLGVTAAFNKNLLQRLNSEIGATFDLDEFEHLVHWNAGASRIEMHLVSRRRQDVRVPGVTGPLAFTLEPGESIWTESSYKYEPDAVRTLVESAGFDLRARWIDDEARFLLALCEGR